MGRDGGDVLPAEMRDFVVRKKDGFPAYQLSSVVDDIYYGVDLVVRGEDLRASTEAQLFLAKALAAAGMTEAAAFGEVGFVHHPLLTMADGKNYTSRRGRRRYNIYESRVSPADVFAPYCASADWRSRLGIGSI